LNEDSTVKKVGRKPLLTEEEKRQLQAEYARYQRVAQRYQRLMAKLSPQSLARKYGISPSTVLDYARGRHKGEPNYGLSGAAVRKADART